MVLTTFSFVTDELKNIYQPLNILKENNTEIHNCIITSYGKNICINLNIDNNGVNICDLLRKFQMIRENKTLNSTSNNTFKICIRLLEIPNLVEKIIHIILENNFELELLEYNRYPNSNLNLKIKTEKSLNIIRDKFSYISDDKIII